MNLSDKQKEILDKYKIDYRTIDDVVDLLTEIFVRSGDFLDKDDEPLPECLELEDLYYEIYNEECCKNKGTEQCLFSCNFFIIQYNLSRGYCMKKRMRIKYDLSGNKKDDIVIFVPEEQGKIKVIRIGVPDDQETIHIYILTNK